MDLRVYENVSAEALSKKSCLRRIISAPSSSKRVAEGFLRKRKHFTLFLGDMMLDVMHHNP